MDDDLQLDLPPEDEIAPILPYNYFPAALAAISENHTARNRNLFVLPHAHPSPLDEILSYVVSVETLQNPAKMSAFLSTLEPALDPNLANQSCFLGPETDLAQTNHPRTQKLTVTELGADAPYARVVVVIDHGIAFWNLAFRSAGKSRFSEIQFLDFNSGAPSAALPVGRLTEADIAAHCSTADLSDGQATLLQSLKKQFPRSFYGSYPPPDADGLWHGTAIADIAVPDDGGKTALFGIELPDAALRDWGGDTLQYVLPSALRAALAMTSALAHLPLIIVLPFAFTAGPHDGSHPIALDIKYALDQARTTRPVSLLLPAGNHLQDQCTAIIPPTPPGAVAAALTWHLPPDDFSPNTVEIIVENVGLDPNRPRVEITMMNGRAVQAELLQNQVAQLKLGTVVIGILARAADIGSNARYRISMSPTGWIKGNQRPAPFGDWAVSIATTQPASLWVLRDERDMASDMARPNRGSYFTDPNYRVRDASGDFVRDDKVASAVRRSGTASVMSTAVGATTVEAVEKLGPDAPRQAFYSGRAIAGGAFDMSVLVDDGYQGRGMNAVGNGTGRVFRVSGTSAATARAARDIYP